MEKIFGFLFSRMTGIIAGISKRKQNSTKSSKKNEKEKIEQMYE